MRLSFARAARAAALLALPAAGCGPDGASTAWRAPTGTEAPSLVLVTLDTLRADRLGAYGGDPSLSPAFDGLARRGTLFEACDSVSPLTLPSHATLLTGLEPPDHGLRSNGRGRLPASIPTLAQVLSAHGYTAGAFVSSAVLDRRHGLDAGFAVYDDEVGEPGERRGDATLERALAWWRSAPRPAFLWLHLFDPHAPYRPPEPYARIYRARPYDGEIAHTDAVLGRLLGAVQPAGGPAPQGPAPPAGVGGAVPSPGEEPGARPVVVAVVGDHGEGLGDHGEAEHGLLLHQATLAVPLVLTGPGISTGRRRDPVRTVDLFPTLLALLGLETPTLAGPGRNLLQGTAGQNGAHGREDPPGRRGVAAAGRAGTAERSLESSSPPAYAETLLPWEDYGWSPLRSLRMGRFKLTRGAYDALHDLEADPGELRNLLAPSGGDTAPTLTGAQAAALAALRHELDTRQAGWTTGAPSGTDQRATGPDPVDPLSVERLRSLGYLGGAAASPPPPPGTRADGARGDGGEAALLDPRGQVGLHQRVRTVLARYRDGDLDGSARALTAILAEQPANPFLRDLAGSIALARGRPDEAVAHHRAALELGPDRAAVKAHLAEALLAAGRPAEAEAAARQALDGDPAGVSPVRPGLVLALSLWRQGRPGEAAEAARRVLARLPGGGRETDLVRQLRSLAGGEAPPGAGEAPPSGQRGPPEQNPPPPSPG